MAATSFASLKKNRNKSFEKLNDQLQKINSKGYVNPDADKYWKPTRDAAGNGFAIIRFLPEPEGEDFTFVRLWDHAFQGPTGMWYIENSRKTLGMDEPDPMSEYNVKMWNSTTDDNAPARVQVRTKQKRNLHFISNVYIVKDSGNPANEGKVFLFKYGKKIFNMLNEKMNPQFEDEEKMNPFDLWSGANFRLKIRMVDGFPNYEKSDFDSPGPLFEDEDRMEAVWRQCHSLKDVVSPHNFKSYEELQAKLHRVLGISEAPQEQRKTTLPSSDEEIDDSLDMSRLGSSRDNKTADAPQIKQTNDDDDDDDDDSLEYFKNLASKV